LLILTRMRCRGKARSTKGTLTKSEERRASLRIGH
jgi:hypothetical protein